MTRHARPTRLRLEPLEGRDVPTTLYGLTSTQALIRFDAATPGAVTTLGTITGQTAGQTIVDIAVRPATGQVYALGFNPNAGAGTGIGELYTLNVNTLHLTHLSSPFSTTLNSTTFGMSFDPVADQLYFLGANGTAAFLSPTTGQYASGFTTLSPISNYPGVAYDRPGPGLSATTLFAYDYTHDKIVEIGSPGGSPNPASSGIVTAVGASGVVTSGAVNVGMAAATDGTLYLNAVVGGVDRLYNVSTAAGGVSVLGTFPTGTTVLKTAVLPPELPVLASGGPDGSVHVYTSTTTTDAGTTLAGNPFTNMGVDVRAAVGDVNGDGAPDDILCTGPGIEFKVAVVSGKDGSLLVQPFDPFLPAAGQAPFTAGGFVSAADFLTNGRDQIVITPDRSGGPRVAIYDMNGAAAAPAGSDIETLEKNPGSGLSRKANFLSVDANFRGGARTAAGDLNGDGLPDLAIAAGFGGGPAVLVIDGRKVLTTNGFTQSDDVVSNFFAFDSGLRDGAYLAIGDVFGSGTNDLILGPGDGGPNKVEVLNGRRLTTQGAVSAIANPDALFTPTGLGGTGSGMRVAFARNAFGSAFLIAAPGKNQVGAIKAYQGTGITFGSTNEPTGGSLAATYGGAVLTDGMFVG